MLPPELVGFDRGAETVTANYSLRSGPATLTIIDYPTPQMAEAQETEDSRLHQGRQARRSRRGPSRWQIPTRHRSRCAAAGRWSRWSAATPFPTRATSCSTRFTSSPTLLRSRSPTESEVAKTGKLLLGIAALVIDRLRAPPFCWDFFSAAAGRSIAWRGASRSRRSTTRSSFASICGKSGSNARDRQLTRPASEGLMASV